MLRVDLERRLVTASVREIAELAGGALRAVGTAGMFGAELGAAIHRGYRADREARIPGFRGEVAVVWEHAVDGFTVRISGRVDGIIDTGGGTLRVEEVKSTTHTGPALAGMVVEDAEPAARLQAALYALVLARTRPDITVSVGLVLVSVVDRTERTLEVPFDPAASERRLAATVRSLIAGAQVRARRAERRAGRADGLRWPFDGHRPGQDLLVDHIHEALGSGRPVLAEAPTGIGKTAAALLPALRLALRHDGVVFYATAKRTQRAHVADTFQRIARASGLAPGAVRATTLRPRESMCPTGRLLCHVDHCPLLANLERKALRAPVVDGLLAGATHVAPEAIYRAGDRADLCPHGLAQRIAARVDLVIGDYNHLYRPAVRPGTCPGEAFPRPVVAIVDEAHNLPERARGYDSVFLGRARVAALADRFPVTETGRDDLRAGLGHVFRDLLDLVDETVRAAVESEEAAADGVRPAALDREPWEALADRCVRLAVWYLHEAGSVAPSPAEDPPVDLLADVVRIRDLLLRDDPSLVPHASCGGGEAEAGVGILSVDASARLRERHRLMLGTIAMSATLTPVEHYRDGLGLSGLLPAEITLPSPFPAEHRRVLIDTTISTTWRGRSRDVGRVARALEQVVAARPGHYAAYFPSFRYLEAVRARLALDSGALLVQRPGMSDRERRAALDRLRHEDPCVPLLLLAVTGGVLAEGVDLPGDALVGVVVVGPALPPVGFERDAIYRHHDERGEDGLARAMLDPGMRRVVQAAGRVHRTPSDRGVIVLLGRRFAAPQYAACLPTWWSRHGVEGLLTDDLSGDLDGFWSAVHPVSVSR